MGTTPAELDDEVALLAGDRTEEVEARRATRRGGEARERLVYPCLDERTGELDQERRRALDLVDRGRDRQVPHESFGVGAGGVEGSEIVERDEPPAPTLAELSREGRPGAAARALRELPRPRLLRP